MLQILCLSNNVLVGNKQDQIKLIFTNRISYETREKTSHREREKEGGRERERADIQTEMIGVIFSRIITHVRSVCPV